MSGPIAVVLVNTLGNLHGYLTQVTSVEADTQIWVYLRTSVYVPPKILPQLTFFLHGHIREICAK